MNINNVNKDTLDDSSLSTFDVLKDGSMIVFSGWWWAIIFRYLNAVTAIYKNNTNREIKVLDVGGSVGNFYRFLNNFCQFPGRKRIKKYTLVEINEKYISKFLKKYPTDDYPDCEIVRNIDESSETVYDAIICMELLEHLGYDNANDMLKSMYNKLSDNGICIISSPNPKKDQGINFVWPENHIYEFSRLEMINIIESNNFQIIETFGWLGKAAYMKKHFSPFQRKMYNKLNKMGNSGFAASIMAQIYPDLAECYVIVCRKK